MVRYIPPPSSRDLLLPLLACLPTAFASKRPPPALLPLLSPILRQRVQLLSDNSSSDSWIPLLCWDARLASRLPDVIRRLELEPHPVSGEIEVEDPDKTEYRRLDEETLQARLALSQFDLAPTYLWCIDDEAGGGDGWRLGELRVLEDMDNQTPWYSSMGEADERAKENYVQDVLRQDSGPESTTGGKVDPSQAAEDDDDDYWAAYDRTPDPGRTPMKRSPAPATSSRVQLGPTQTELEYFARYGVEVQPAMDPHDPDEEGTGPGESTLNGGALVSSTMREPHTEHAESTNADSHGPDSSLPPHVNGNGTIVNNVGVSDEPPARQLYQPRPSSRSSSSSVERLEQSVVEPSQAEIGIKQHISTDIKSLYRLSKAAGIERAEFERIVKTELELLSLMDME